MWKPLAGIFLVLSIVYIIYEPALTKRSKQTSDSGPTEPPKPVIDFTVEQAFAPIKNFASKATTANYKKIAVGYNTNTDLIVSATGLLDELAKSNDLVQFCDINIKAFSLQHNILN